MNAKYCPCFAVKGFFVTAARLYATAHGKIASTLPGPARDPGSTRPHNRDSTTANAQRLWKWRSVESLENQNQVFHPFPRPWKSLRAFHIPTALAGQGKVESQQQASHFPSALLLPLSIQSKKPKKDA